MMRRGKAPQAVELGLHLADAVKVPDGVRGREEIPPPHRHPADLLDETHVAALVAPRLVNRRGVERHAGQPRHPLAADLAGADHALGQGILAALVQVPRIGREVVEEIGRRYAALVREVHLLERVAVCVLDVAGHVDAQEDVRHIVGAFDAVGRQKVPPPRREDQHLRPL
ncbi:MAG: hypothetical protein NTX87_17765 [Planctomycetota bacterium]|nr:hypothetical protein [Planctomycetota bacterium]